MKGSIILKGLVVIFFIITLPKWAMAKGGKPLPGIKMDNTMMVRMVADTTAPGQKKKSSDKTDENSKDQTQVQEVKVIPIARRQPIPVPVNVNIQPVKIIKPIVKPVIRILH